MRKSMVTLGLGLALSFGALGAAGAQSTQTPTPRQGQHEHEGMRGPGRRGGGFQKALLKGITLNADQQKRVDALRKDEQSRMQSQREQFGKVMADARQARERGDTASARKSMQEVRSQMEHQREQNIASLRAILTPDQQKLFDANVTEMKAHAKDRGFGNRTRKGDRAQGDRGQGQK